MVNRRCTAGGLLGVALHLGSPSMLNAESLSEARCGQHGGRLFRHDNRRRSSCAREHVVGPPQPEVHVERTRRNTLRAHGLAMHSVRNRVENSESTA